MIYQMVVVTGPGHRLTVLTVDCPTDVYASTVAERAAQPDRSVDVRDGARRVSGLHPSLKPASGTVAPKLQLS